MNEMLRKEDVLKALSAKIDELEKRDAKADVILGLATAMSVVKLMEGEPAEKVGHWIDHQEDRWIYAKCSECETIHDTRTNYCPNCGSRMMQGVEE